MPPVSEKRKQYEIDYIKQNQRQFLLRVNRKLEPEMIEWLEGKGNVQAYLKELIRKDMEASTDSST